MKKGIIIMIMTSLVVGTFFETNEDSVLAAENVSYVESANKELKDLVENYATLLSFQDFSEIYDKISGQIEQVTDDEMLKLIANKIQEKLQDLETKPQTYAYEVFGKKITAQEALLVATFPADAVKIYNNATIAGEKASSIYTEHSCYQGNGDAYRHCYWNALNVISVGETNAEMFATAHESESSGIDKQMDLANNSAGRVIGTLYSSSQIVNIVQNWTDNGKLWRIKNNELVPTNTGGKL